MDFDFLRQKFDVSYCYKMKNFLETLNIVRMNSSVRNIVLMNTRRIPYGFNINK